VTLPVRKKRTDIDFVLIDQQSVGKRRLHLINTANVKKRWTTIYYHDNKFLIINDINDISFLERLTAIITIL
jgi:hypothetical protein